MSSSLSAHSTVDEWLSDPAGRGALAGVAAAAGASVDAFANAGPMTLSQLVPLSGGLLTATTLNELVRSVGGTVDPEDEGNNAPASALPPASAAWAEIVSPGRFAGQTIIVTGAGSGIGRAVALRVAKEGGRVVAADVSAARLDDLVAEYPDLDLVVAAGDISKTDDVDSIIHKARGKVDGLANVAGIMDNMTPLHEVSDEVWERVFRINVTGTFSLTRAVVPLMLAAARGAIVNISSEAGLRGSSAGFAYTASKHAVVGMTRSAAFMYGPSGIRVNCVAPGSTITNIQASFDSALGRDRILPVLAVAPAPVEAARIAASITFLLSDDGVNLNGVILPSDNGQSVI